MFAMSLPMRFECRAQPALRAFQTLRARRYKADVLRGLVVLGRRVRIPYRCHRPAPFASLLTINHRPAARRGAAGKGRRVSR